MDNTPKTKTKKVTTPTNKDLEPILSKSKGKGVTCFKDSGEDIALETHHSESDSPPPSWDDPYPTSTTAGDLTELHIQTDQFAQKQVKALEATTQPNFSPESLNSSSRSSSYSSIVSSSSGEGASGKNKGDKRFAVGYTPFSETMQVPLTPRTPPISYNVPSSMGNMRKAWTSTGGSAPPTPDNIGFGLQTIQESSRPGSTLTDSQADRFTQPGFGYGTAVQRSLAAEPSFGYMGDLDQTKSMSMMQQLQMDRRRRVQEHNLRLLKEDWPYFDMPMASSQSLWDSEYSPLEPNQNAWSVNTETSPVSASNGIWSTLTNSANSGWNSLMGIWGSQPAPSVADNLNQETPYTTPTDGATSSNASTNQNAEALPAFSPFSSDIWSPSASTASTGWQMPSGQPMSSPPDETEN